MVWLQLFGNSGMEFLEERAKDCLTRSMFSSDMHGRPLPPLYNPCLHNFSVL